MVKILNLNKILLKENRRYLLTSICLVILLNLLYFKFCNSSTDTRKILFDWIGGTNGQIYSFSMLVLKLSFISIIFLYIGRITEQIKSNFIYYLAPRIGSTKEVIINFISLILLQGILLAIIFKVAFLSTLVIYTHDFYALVSIIYNIASYTIIECISMIGVILIYIIIEFVFTVNNSFLVIITLYLVNSIIPYNFPIAIFTSRLGGIYYKGEIMKFGIFVCISTIVIALILKIFIDKKEIKLC